MSCLSTENIIGVFQKEFAFLQDKFLIIKAHTNEDIKFMNCDIWINDHWESKIVDTDFENESIAKPGVYVIWKDFKDNNRSNVIKVGRHLENSRFRAFQHLKATYPSYEDMKSLKQDNEARILLFNLKESNNKYWAAALEIYLELSLQPIVKANRLG